MIRIENFVPPSPGQWQAVMRGMRNPMNSWDMGDSKHDCNFLGFSIGEKDMRLAKGLIAKGVADRKFLRQLPVIMNITAPLYWWKQMDKYQVGTVTDSCSTMHKLTEKEFEESDFSFEAMYDSNIREDFFETFDQLASLKFDTIRTLNELRDKYFETGKKFWWKAIVEFLPESYNQKRTFSANYEVLRNICHQRDGHKLKEWADFIEWVRIYVPYAEELIFDGGEGQ